MFYSKERGVCDLGGRMGGGMEGGVGARGAVIGVNYNMLVPMGEGRGVRVEEVDTYLLKCRVLISKYFF